MSAWASIVSKLLTKAEAPRDTMPAAESKRPVPAELYAAMTERWPDGKRCGECGHTKPAADFYVKWRAPNTVYLYADCKQCHNNQCNQSRQKRRDAYGRADYER